MSMRVWELLILGMSLVDAFHRKANVQKGSLYIFYTCRCSFQQPCLAGICSAVQVFVRNHFTHGCPYISMKFALIDINCRFAKKFKVNC